MGLQQLLCLSAFLACASASYYYGCPTLFNFYPDVNDCTRFYRCVWGRPVFFNCPAGTRWSQHLLTCDHAHKVPCGHYNQGPHHVPLTPVNIHHAATTFPYQSRHQGNRPSLPYKPHHQGHTAPLPYYPQTAVTVANHPQRAPLPVHQIQPFHPIHGVAPRVFQHPVFPVRFSTPRGYVEIMPESNPKTQDAEHPQAPANPEGVEHVTEDVTLDKILDYPFTSLTSPEQPSTPIKPSIPENQLPESSNLKLFEIPVHRGDISE